MRIIKHISHSVFQENTYILYKNNDILIIDPGDSPQYYKQYLSSGKNLKGVLATHGHLDHIVSASVLCEHYSCPFVMSSKDQEVLDRHESSCKKYRLEYFGTPEITLDVSEINELQLGEFVIKILHTPGHTRGGVCYLIDGVLFSGDTLFRRSVGHVNQYGGKTDILFRSIKEKLYELQDELIVYPGHMESTTIGDEKKYNPYIRNT